MESSDRLSSEPLGWRWPRGVALPGGYHPILELGRGGMSTVFLAVRFDAAGLQKLSAVKHWDRGLADGSESPAMFLEEARLAARLRHANVVQTWAAEVEKPHYYIVMEFLEGQTLQSVLRIEPELQRHGRTLYLQVLIDALAGLHYIHELEDLEGRSLDVVHRDVSPANLFVTYDGEVKVLDFGIAKFVGSEVVTEPGLTKGKVPYMSPERFERGPVDRRTDVFAMGAVLWHLLTGMRLWQGLSDAEILGELRRGEIANPRSVDPTIPEELDRICSRALAIDPMARFATAEQLRSALESYLESCGIVVSRRQLGDRIGELFREHREQFWRRVRSSMPRAPRSAPVAPRRKVRRRRVSLWRSVGSTLFSGSLVLILLCAGPCLPQAFSPRVTPEPVVSEISTARPLCMIELNAVPGDAQFFIDGSPVPLGVTELSLPRDGAFHKVGARAAGYAAYEDVIAFDRARIRVRAVLQRDLPDAEEAEARGIEDSTRAKAWRPIRLTESKR